MSIGTRRRHRITRPPPGSPPGTMTVAEGMSPPLIRVIAYGPNGLDEYPAATPDQIRLCLGGRAVTWIDVDGLGDADTISAVGALVGMHRLSLEDVVHVHQRPKVEDYGDYLFIVVRMPRKREPDDGGLRTEQVSVCLGKGVVITFQERKTPGDVFDPVRARIRAEGARMRTLGADYLAYALTDAVIDAYFPVLEDFGERLDELEEGVLFRPDPSMSRTIHEIKRDLVTVRRATWPLRDALGTLLRDRTPLVSDDTRLYFRDSHDHAVQIIDLVETYRELGSGLMEVYLSSVSNRMNEIIKVLTIISTIFIPLTFLVGLYGMNFDTSKPGNMPELHWPYAYPVLLLIMLVTVAAMLLWFRRRGWLGRTFTTPPESVGSGPARAGDSLAPRR